MIRAVRANDSRFKTVQLHEGLNLVLADTTSTSTATDTRNGVGKTLLIEILHFCLGATAPASGGLASPELVGWLFTIDLDLGGQRCEASRALGDAGSIRVNGDFSNWPVQPSWDAELASFRLTVEEWKDTLGALTFDLGSIDGGYRFRPSFRSLVSYFARVHTGAYTEPFKYFSGEREWQKQVYVAYLLDLAWEQAAEFQDLKERKDALRTLNKALEAGALGEPEATIGELRAQRVRTASRVEDLERQLSDFEVHPQYGELAQEADALTQELHALTNDQLIRQRTLTLYEDQLQSENGPDSSQVIELFAEAGVVLSDNVVKTLDEAQGFHARVIRNRKTYLEDEMTTLRAASVHADAEIAAASERRAGLMQILETQLALDEFNKLTERLAEFRARVSQLEAQIARISEVEERRSELEIATQELLRASRRELAERETQWGEAIELFAEATRALYGTPGELVIDVGESGFVYDVRIERSGSHGIDNMKIFAFDLMLARRWAAKSASPGFLWHDSQLYDGVDERQVAAALRLAANEATECGFQYLCTMNSDDLPAEEYLGGIGIAPVLTLTDSTEDGGLFGMRF